MEIHKNRIIIEGKDERSIQKFVCILFVAILVLSVGLMVIDAPGLSILPPRLKKELQTIEKLLIDHADKTEYPELAAHYAWIDDLRQHYTFTRDNTHAILEQEVGNIFVRMLEDCAVFDQTEAGASAFRSFVQSCMIF